MSRKQQDHPPANRKIGRPSKLTPDTEARILNGIRCGAPNKVACMAAGIAEDTLYGWLEKARERPDSDYARFSERLTRARQEGITARLALIQKAAVKDWRAAAWLLERDLPEAFSLRFKIEHTVTEKPFTLADAIAKLERGPRWEGAKLIEGEPA